MAGSALAVSGSAYGGSVTLYLTLVHGSYVVTGESTGTPCGTLTTVRGSATITSETSAAPDAVGAYLTASDNTVISWVCQANAASDTGWLDAVPVHNAAQLTLIDAMSDAMTFYQRAQTYDAATTTASSQGSGSGTTVQSLVAQDEKYGWVSGSTSCTAGPSKPCVSVEPVDSANANDGQGIVLAASSDDGSCWWLADLQRAPVALYGDDSFEPTSFMTAVNSPTDNGALISRAGVYYAEELDAGTGCSADRALSAAGFKWADDFSETVSN